MKHSRPAALAALIPVLLCILYGPGSASNGDTNKNNIHPEIHCKHFMYGYPAGTPANNDLIIRDIYALSSNDERKFADWVAYRLDGPTILGSIKTSRKWTKDPWLDDHETLEPKEYDGASAALGVDRGHQAPLASFKGTPDWHETNYLSNITPQRSALNQGPWKKIEDLERSLVREYGTVHVMTGPLYTREMAKLPGTDKVHCVPSGYWKIILISRPGGPGNTLHCAFMFDQDTPGAAKIADHICSIDDIEAATGLDFLWSLEDDCEDAIEAKKCPFLATGACDCRSDTAGKQPQGQCGQ
jgi:endonuclease G